MKKSKIITVIFFLALMGGCKTLERREMVIANKDVYSLTFFDVTKGNNMVYTTDKESVEVKKSKKNTLDKKIVGKLYSDKKYYVVEKDGKKGLIDEKMRDVLTCIYDDIFTLGKNFVGGRKEDKTYLIDIDRYEIKGEFDSLALVNDGKIIQGIKDGRTIYLDIDGDEIEELGKYEVFFFRDDVAITKKGNLFGLYNLKTQEHYPEINEEIYFSGENILVKRDGKYYLNDEVLDIKRFYPTSSDVIIYDYNEGFGLLNLRDKKFYNTVYDEVAPYFDRYTIVGRDGKYDVMDKYKEEELLYPYDYILKLGENSFIAGTEKTNSFALIVDGQRVTEEKFENIVMISENYYMGVIGNSITVIDRDGYEIVECNKQDVIYYNDRIFIVQEGEQEHLYILEEVKR